MNPPPCSLGKSRPKVWLKPLSIPPTKLPSGAIQSVPGGMPVGQLIAPAGSVTSGGLDEPEPDELDPVPVDPLPVDVIGIAFRIVPILYGPARPWEVGASRGANCGSRPFS